MDTLTWHFSGIPFVVVCYLLVNMSFLAVLSVQEIAHSPALAVTFVERVLGKKVTLYSNQLILFRFLYRVGG